MGMGMGMGMGFSMRFPGWIVFPARDGHGPSETTGRSCIGITSLLTETVTGKG